MTRYLTASRRRYLVLSQHDLRDVDAVIDKATDGRRLRWRLELSDGVRSRFVVMLIVEKE